MLYRVAAEDRERLSRASGAVAGDDFQWTPLGMEHAFRLGDQDSLCGLSLGPLRLFPDFFFLIERNPDFLCGRCASLVSAAARQFGPG